MKLELRRTSWLLLGYLAGCTWMAPQPAPIRVQGESRDIRQLAGTWRGEFHNAGTGRVGTIFFDLRADSDTAYGSVTFDRVVPITACTDMTRPQATSSIVVPVVLRFGALATYRGSLGGWLQPYRDPDLSCWMDAPEILQPSSGDQDDNASLSPDGGDSLEGSAIRAGALR